MGVSEVRGICFTVCCAVTRQRYYGGVVFLYLLACSHTYII